MSDDEENYDEEDIPACCPYCDKEDCSDHLLGCFDVTFADQGEGKYGIGIVAGHLYHVREIGEVLEQVRLAWVRSMRVGDKPESPDWIGAVPALRDYFGALGSAGDFDVSGYEDDEEAASDLSNYTDEQSVQAREFLERLLRQCGWSEETTCQDHDAPLQSTSYLSWWDSKPNKVTDALRALLRRILDEATTRDEGASVVGRVAAVSSLRQGAPVPTRVADSAASRALRIFLTEELQRFGTDPAYRAVLGAVHGAYEPAIRSLSVPERVEVYEHILGLVEATQLDPHALVPVAMMDPHGPLASRAALDVCMLLPRSLGEPTRGMAYLGALLMEGKVENRGAVFGGVLCLGDRRAHPWLLRVRDTLTENEVDQFSRTATGVLSAASVEFVLDWMEQRRKDYSDHVFGALAAWMVRQRTVAGVPSVITGERTIPPGVVDAEEENRRLALVPLLDYSKSIAGRLNDIERAEPEPKCMDHVVAVWSASSPSQADEQIEDDDGDDYDDDDEDEEQEEEDDEDDAWTELLSSRSDSQLDSFAEALVKLYRETKARQEAEKATTPPESSD